MLATDARAGYIVIDPTLPDVRKIGADAKDLGCAIAAHPDTLDRMHAALVQHGPLIRRTTLGHTLDVPVIRDDTIPEPLVLLVPEGASA